MPKDPEFLYFKNGADGYITRPHQKSELRFVGAETLMWTSGIALPVFWSIFFLPEYFTESGATVDGATALALVARREKSLREKSSPLIERGLLRFVDWAKRTRANRIELDLRDLETWRYAPLLAAFGELTKFIDEVSNDPGPLPPRDDATVGWRAQTNEATRIVCRALRVAGRASASFAASRHSASTRDDRHAPASKRAVARVAFRE